MEVNRTRWLFSLLVRFIAFMLLLPSLSHAQESVTKYSVKNGRMYIEITRDASKEELNAFIAKFDLEDLYLREFFSGNRADSLRKKGWRVEKNNETGFVISKPFTPYEKINDPVDRMIITEKHPTFAERFPAKNNGIVYGYNRFRNKHPFRQDDSVVVFFLRNHVTADRVMLAGSFNDWKPNALAMKKTDSGWIARVKLGPGKYWYKFVADGRWMVDNDNLAKENDGYGNINSVFFVTNTRFYLKGYTGAKNVSLGGSFNQWRSGDLKMERSGDGWTLPLYLSEGTHTYKFAADGAWITDETNASRLPDGKGGYNSVISLGKPQLFRLNGYQQAKEVKLAASFNNWRDFELPMVKKNGGWELSYVVGPGNYEYKFKVDNAFIADPSNPSATGNGSSYLIIDPNYTFRLKGYPAAQKVFLAGDFNNWNPSLYAMKKVGDEWLLPVHLSVGKHLYKFVVDGQWIKDPGNKLWEQNEYGTGNSIVWIDR